MIPSAPVSTLVDIAELATSATTAAIKPVANATAPFDAIMALESLAATCNALSADALEGVVEGLAESEDTDDTETEDGEEGELGALEFLAALLNTPMPFKAHTAGHQAADGQGAAADRTDAPVEMLPSAAKPAGSEPGLSLAESANQILEKATDVSTDKLLAIAGQVATAADGLTPSRDGTVDPAAPMTRGAELFAHATRHAPGAERSGIVTHMRDPRWADEFATRMTLMVRGGESQASLQLSPVDLGPMDVNVSVRDSQASIHFGAANAETRALIEASIPRLREMLAAQGFNLLDASVSQGFARQSQQGTGSGAGLPADGDAGSEVTVARVTASGLLDLYA